MNSSRSHSKFVRGLCGLCASQLTVTSCPALASVPRGKLMTQKQPLGWSQMPRTEQGWGGHVGKALFVQPSLVHLLPAQPRGVLTLGKPRRRKR